MAILGVAAAALAGLGGVYFWRKRAVGVEAAEEYAARRDRGDPALEAVSADMFARAYARVYGPRALGYGLAAGAALAVLTPVLIGPAAALVRMATRNVEVVNMTTGIVDLSFDGVLVYQFWLFFAVPALWTAVAGVFVYRYHRGRPAAFNLELKRAKAGLV